MTVLPTRSPGVLLSWLDDGGVALDLSTDTVHHLNSTAAALLARCDGLDDEEAAVAEWAAATGADRSTVARDVEAGIVTLTDLGLLGRTRPFEVPAPLQVLPSETRTGARIGAVHRAIDRTFAFRGPQPELLQALDRHLGTGEGDAEAATPTFDVFDVLEEANGEVVLTTDSAWRFPDRASCLRQLTALINVFAVHSDACLVLHAGAVRSPTGEIVVLPGSSGSGKSTLTAALVAAGWDYLGDEAIGVRAGALTAVGYPKRLAIDGASRRALHLAETDEADLDPSEVRPGVVRLAGDVGPTGGVILPRYVEGAAVELEDLDTRHALDALLANTLNLARIGQPGLDALCALAASVRVRTLVHGDAHGAARALSR